METDTSARRPAVARERKPVGRHYTPEWVVQLILDGCLAPGEPPKPFRILDPACGDGAFLIPAFLRLAAKEQPTPRGRLRVVRDHFFGVDLDAAAVVRLRRRLRDLISAPPGLEIEVEEVLAANFPVGDSLAGAGFGDDLPPPACCNDRVIDWPSAFAHAASDGGFDLIVGNPPYLRERGAKGLFAEIARSPLGCWREARMDLWHYFAHRGLDLLRPGGRLAFIVSSYWAAATGARKLKGRLTREATVEEITLLGDRRIFSGVSGRHMIFRIRKGYSDELCRVVELSSGPRLSETWRSVRQSEVLYGGSLIAPATNPAVPTYAMTVPLGDLHPVRQGIAENPPTIHPRVARDSQGRFRAGEGVFVVTEEELADLRLSPGESRLLRPYHPVSELARYRIPDRPRRFLLYLTAKTAPTLEGSPGIRRHLERFRTLLEQRREVRTGAIAWWHLHWPRQEWIFVEPRILSPQMGRVPQFVWVERPTFVGFSVNVILGADGGWDLRALTGVLNSNSARHWFESHAKRRGVALDISGTLLRRFPLPPRDAALERDLSQMVARRQSMPADDDASAAEAGIDALVSRLYGVR